MSNTESACLNMHSMSVLDRVMYGSVHAVHDPGELVFNDGHLEDEVLEMMEKNKKEYAAAAVNNGNQGEQRAAIGLENKGNEFIIHNMIARQLNWQNLSDTDKHNCLHSALMQVKGN